MITIPLPLASNPSPGIVASPSLDSRPLLPFLADPKGCLCRSHGERGGLEHILEQDRGNAASGGPSSSISSFLENLVQPFAADPSKTAKYADGNVPVASRGASEHHDFKFPPQRGQEPNLFKSRNSLQSPSKGIDERPQDTTAATEHSNLFSTSAETLRLSENEAENGDHAASANLEEDILLLEARYRALRGRTRSFDADDWKRLAHATTAGDTFSVPNQRLTKMAELRRAEGVQEAGRREQRPHPHVEERADHSCGEPLSHFDQHFKDSKAESNTGPEKFWTFAEVRFRFPMISDPVVGKAAVGIFIAGALFIMVGVWSSACRLPQTHSVKRRILRSQWYANPGTQTMVQRNAQMRRFELPSYPVSEVDGDKKILHSPFHEAHMSKRNPESSNETKSMGQSYVRSAGYTCFPYSNEVSANHVGHKKKFQSPSTSNGKALAVSESVAPAVDKLGESLGSHDSKAGERQTGSTWLKTKSAKQESFAGEGPMKTSIVGETSRRRSTKMVQVPNVTREVERRSFRMSVPLTKTNGANQWQEEDELDLDRRIKKLRQTIQAVDQHRRVAMLVLAEERQRSMELDVKINKQREAAAALEEEIRVLKDSHDALLASLRKKYSSSAAARAAADLLYQDWEFAHGSSVSEAGAGFK